MNPQDFAHLYRRFDAPITALDCGQKCAPYNEYGVPFCCDTRHAVPTAYFAEWEYLRTSSDLWHIWSAPEAEETDRLRAEAPEGQVLIECQGHLQCQRGYRSWVCRAFPFFPYLTKQNDFIGLSYYWEYEDRCWVINHLETVTPSYVNEFVAAFDELFAKMPGERQIFGYHSTVMRRYFGHRKRPMPLLLRDGSGEIRFSEVLTRTGEVRPADPMQWPKFGPYAIAAELKFPGE
jgi:hypothetical protein